VEGAVKISLDKVQKLGVRTERVTLRDLTRAVRAVGTIEASERLTYTITPKFDGWVERLYVNTTGEPVQRGQALLDVYSPELVATQQEYLIALKGAQAVKDADPEIQERMQELVDSAMQRLDYWDISPKELRELRTEGKIRRVLTFRSPVNGVVLDKPVLKGMRFMPGEMLYKIADLSTVWLMAEVFEQDLGLVHPEQQVRIGVETYPGKDFTGTLVFVYPTLNPGTRTGRVRVEIPNPDLLLKPAMYANVEIAADQGEPKVLAVPDSAVLDSGVRQIVLIERGEGLFEPREVKLGARADGYFEVLDGLREEDQVVVSANFLIDADSNLKAALGSFGGHSGHGAAPAMGTSPSASTSEVSSELQTDAAEHTGH
ncbi:MAG: efflux RND transporter periplasmic adaptor subunit, partial [Gammaproteobacteria bacterium]|nr:efflux RND transporter periplasmic adaptor subunit [Gammaproteobacteria bacterium]